MATRLQVVFDTADPHAQARFWAQAVRYQLEDHSPVVAHLSGGWRDPEPVLVPGGRQPGRRRPRDRSCSTAAAQVEAVRLGVEHLFDPCHAAAMAGGMSRGTGRTLADRSGASAPATPAAPGPPALQTRRVVTRHCWVSGLPDCPGRFAGLLSEWRQEPDGRWCGRVVYVLEEAGKPVLVETWVAAAHLRPV
jgi:hypothetical protein